VHDRQHDLTEGVLRPRVGGVEADVDAVTGRIDRDVVGAAEAAVLVATVWSPVSVSTAISGVPCSYASPCAPGT